MRPALRRMVLIASPLALGVLLLFHPPGGTRVYDATRNDVTAWLMVHIGLALGAGLMAFAAFTLLHGLRGTAATVSRVGASIFVVFFIAWEATLGIGTGILIEHANSLPAGERGPIAEAIQDYFNNPLTGSLSVFGSIGNTAWVVAMTAAAVALRKSGASRLVAALVGCSSIFVLHDAGPIGAIGLGCFAAAAALIERDARSEALAKPAVAGAAIGVRADVA